ncbi:MAG: ABC transporter ATP-binding protein, partial [Betaproteobacteria bacterium]
MIPTPLLSVKDLSVGFASGRTLLTAVSEVSFDLAAGETLALLGESGCGKSVTALSLLRLLPAAGRILGGEVRFAGNDLLQLPEVDMRAVRGGGMAMIFQEPATSLNPVMTVGRQIEEVLERHLALSGEAARQRALELLNAVGISDAARRLDEFPFQLSGGMKQRVMIAVALAGSPRLLVADEPTTALDVTIQAQILDLLRRLQAERGMGMLLITHDLGVVAQMAHRVGVMYAGEIIEEAPREAFFTSPRHPYTQKLFAALPDITRRGGRLETIEGQVPALTAMPSGCRFAERCPHAWERCRAEAPQWHQAGDRHRVRCHLLAEPDRVVASALKDQAETNSLATSDNTSLTVANLRVHFPIRRGVFQRTVGHVKAVDDISFELAGGRTLALVGESGCGKTTAGKAILQLIKPSAGKVQLAGRELTTLSRRELRPLRRRMQMIFQDPFASLNPRLSVGEIIGEGMSALGVEQHSAGREAAIVRLLQQVGLDPAAAQRYPHEFSGGQRQRIAIARALAVQPELIVCDEPTSALDVSVQAQILNLLKSLQDDLGLAYLFITHNFAVVEYLAHEVAVMYLGRIVERGLVDEVMNSPRHP